METRGEMAKRLGISLTVLDERVKDATKREIAANDAKMKERYKAMEAQTALELAEELSGGDESKLDFYRSLIAE